MLKKTIIYEDFNGDSRTEDHYFFLKKSKLAEMEMSTEGGLETRLRKIAQERDPKKLTEIFKGIILNSYGLKSEDGKKHVQSAQISEDFYNTAAYDALFMELAGDEDKFLAFVNGILPKDMQEEISKNGGFTKENLEKFAAMK